jgi:Collagen triple helix repeat (20 copies)
MAGATGLQGLTGTAGVDGAAGPQGLQGVQGDVGAAGANGAAGTNGAAGPSGAAGTTGAAGADGAAGTDGGPGTPGAAGAPGATGPQGDMGPVGASGLDGAPGPTGPQGSPGAGTTGAAGAVGPAGPTGATGPSPVAEFAEFFALMPSDNAATVAVGARVQFPRDGPATGSITRLTDSTFQLGSVGTYRVSFAVSVTEAGQLMLQLNGVALSYTVAGRATGTSQVVGEALVTTTAPDAVVGVMSPAGNSTALTITPAAGGAAPVSATLIVQKLG